MLTSYDIQQVAAERAATALRKRATAAKRRGDAQRAFQLLDRAEKLYPDLRPFNQREN